MLDRALRKRLAGPLDRVAERGARVGVRPGAVTAVGLMAGIGASTAVALGEWGAALGLWLLNRALDGLDGSLARRLGPTELGGVLDFVADFVVYSGFIVGVAIEQPASRLACVVLLATYLVNNVALLSFSSMVERLGLSLGDERSLRFTSALVEGSETVVAYTAICLFPGAAEEIVWFFAGAVGLTAAQRVAQAVSRLSATGGGRRRADDRERVAPSRGEPHV